MGISRDLLKKYTYNKIFIETGLGNGTGVGYALSVGFEQIYSIEFYPKRYERGIERFKQFKQVKLICGDSGEELPKLLEKITEPATFWLDAHFDYTVNMAKEYPIPLTDPLPILKEINAIGNHPIKTHTILVDDMIMINKGHPTWPSIKEKDIREALQLANPDYHIYNIMGGVRADRENDILVAEIKRE